MREIERKYEAIEGMELLDPALVLGVDTTTGPDEQILEAVYFDTADLRLLRRLRLGPPRWWLGWWVTSR